MRDQIDRELDRLELLLKQIEAVEDERDTLISVETADDEASRVAMLLGIKGIGIEFAMSWHLNASFGSSTTAAPANDAEPDVVAVAPASAELGAPSVVQGPRCPQWRAREKAGDYGIGTQAAGVALEIRGFWRRHRGRSHEGGLKLRSTSPF
ncbi:MAG: hypothetical protein E5V64_10340 [Mesorhizobium sp.]|nr:MAG: hypothetical protein EOQ49_30255 [Mesorhizobium sp.]RWF26082.1 MAG: hypothetical protein EOS64_02510 [Mesorhizobium sp.]TIT13551.1 MAG: hypothetical protein E5W74_05855 [Mesorhizobium sp.]TIV82840.1 MAG: hypothetical protein E5V64_10340 [Mesorhizobium sp.]